MDALGSWGIMAFAVKQTRINLCTDVKGSMQERILIDTTHPVLLLAVDGMLGGTGVEKLMPCAANAARMIAKENKVRFRKEFYVILTQF